MKNPFNPLWKQIIIDLDKKVFTLKLDNKKDQYIVNGKLTMHEACAVGFTVNGNSLEFKPSLSRPNFSAIVERFEMMLKDNE
jgi:hypothetical protein